MGSSDEEKFQSAADYVAGAVTSGVAGFSDAVKLELYGLYKQATVGQCKTGKPAFWDMSGRAKWDAWSKLGAMGSQEAMQRYISILTQLVPAWRGPLAAGISGADELEGEEGGTSTSTAGGGGGARKGWGPVFSAFAQEEGGAEVGEADGGGQAGRTAPSIHELVGGGNGDGVTAALDCGADVNERNEDGATPLHFAADRGNAEVARALLAAGASVDAQDSDGSTPLHYAALCGHEEVARILLEAGADVRIVNADQETAQAIAPAAWTCWP